MSVTNLIDRRHFLAGAAALGGLACAGPALALAPAPTPIAALWSRVRALEARMAPHADAIAAAFANGGAPGWMRLKGDANALGEERYQLIVAILKSTPRSLDDLAIQGAAARDSDMIHGPRAWAHAQFDRAADEFHRAA